MMWSLKMRWWAGSITDDQDKIEPDVRIFVRYHRPDMAVTLENSVGLQKGMVGIVNGYASRRHRGTNNVIIAHEFLHTLGATDKYSARQWPSSRPGRHCRTRALATVSATLRRDHGRPHRAGRGRFRDSQEPQVRRHRSADSQRNQTDRLKRLLLPAGELRSAYERRPPTVFACNNAASTSRDARSWTHSSSKSATASCWPCWGKTAQARR